VLRLRFRAIVVSPLAVWVLRPDECNPEKFGAMAAAPPDLPHAWPDKSAGEAGDESCEGGKHHFRLLPVRTVTAVRQHQGFCMWSQRPEPLDLQRCAVLVLLSLDRQQGQADGGYFRFDAPSPERIGKPDIRPTVKGGDRDRGDTGRGRSRGRCSGIPG
jgi:hypothetical protein